MSVFLLVMTIVAATPPEQPYRVGIAHFPPMIVIDSKTGAISGSDFDMFELLVDDPDIAWNEDDYDYVVVNSFSVLMSMIEAGEVDIAVDGISITHGRLQKMNFSQPYKNSGLRIMTPPRENTTNIYSYMSKFFRIEILFSLGAFIVNCFFWGIIVWLVERFFYRPKAPGPTDIVPVNGIAPVNGPEQPNIHNFEEGTLAAFDAGTTIGYGRFYPVTRVGQLVIVAAFFCGAIVVGDVISTLTTNKIVNRLEGEINGPDDLKGKSVAVVSGTTSHRVVEEYNPSRIAECDNFFKAVVELRLGEVDAVVADDPVILNYVKENPEHGSVAGSKFHPEDYGIAFGANVDGDLVKKFSIAIARLRESGKLTLIETQWYGE